MTDELKISIITVCYNSENYITETIESVFNQTYNNIEYIIVDGKSTDNTLNIIKEYKSKFGSKMRWVSEKDNGIYDAMNKGIEMASGDVIGFLNSDDFYASNKVVEKIANTFKKNPNIEACYGIIERVNPHNVDNIKRVTRIPSRNNTFSSFKYGWHPAHQSFYAKQGIYDQYGKFDLNFDIAADFDLLCRLFEKHNINVKYLPEAIVKMRNGGVSNRNLKSVIKGNYECYKSLKKYGIFPFLIFIKPFRKLYRKLKVYLDL